MKKVVFLVIFIAGSIIASAQIPYKEKSNDYIFGWQDIYSSVPDVPSCNEGALTSAEKQYVLNYINFIRYLHDLKPVVYDYSGDNAAQKSALIQAANGTLSHTPPPTSACYSQEGYNGSVNSNLHIQWGMGQGSQIDSKVSIIGWMIDNNSQNAVDRCGHRRAIINPFVTAISFGRVEGQGPAGWTMAAALKYMDNVNGNIGDHPVEFVAYPYLNYPPDLVDKSWYLSFSPYYDMSNNFANTNIQYDNTTVEMTDDQGNIISTNSYVWDAEGWGAVQNNFRWKAPGLQNEVKYNVEIKNVVVNGQNRNYSYWFKLTQNIYGIKPETPMLSFPSNNATNTSTNTNFSWSLPSFTYKFQFQLAKDINFTNIVKDTITTINGIVVKNLETATKYYWHVKAMNDNGSSEWSETFSFTTAAPLPGAPKLASPPDNSVDLPLESTLAWFNQPGAERYHLQVSKSASFAGFSSIDEMQITDTSYTINAGELEYGTQYYWHIAAFINGQKSAFSEIWKFKTKDPDPIPDKPNLVSPIDNATDISLTPVLKWDNVPYAEHYTLKIATDESFNSASSVLTKNTDTNEYQVPPQILQPSTKYYWKVQAWHEAGIGDWSKTFKFTTTTEGSVREQIITDGININPNPVKDILYFMINRPVDSKSIFYVSNLLGDKVLEMSFDHFSQDEIYQINTSSLPKGVYFIRIISADSIYLTKFVKN
ncbi:MAG: T9SS type A sorting domain-containing protein [Chloroherpetonaceae bacterium]